MSMLCMYVFIGLKQMVQCCMMMLNRTSHSRRPNAAVVHCTVDAKQTSYTDI